MSDIVVSSGCTIPANPDIAGIGVRIAIYTQNLICILSALWAFWDGKVTPGKLDHAETQTTTNLILAFAILISSIVQARTLGMTNYHANIVLSMSWMNNTNAFVYFILYIHYKIELPAGQGQVAVGWKPWMRHIAVRVATSSGGGVESGVASGEGATSAVHASKRSTSILGKRFVLLLGSFHLTLMSALGVWLWSNPLSFGHGRRLPLELERANKCALGSAMVVIVGQDVRFHSEILRITSLILYGVLAIPGLNLIVPMCVFLGIYVAWTPVVHTLSRVRAFSKARVERTGRRRNIGIQQSFWCHTTTAAPTFAAWLGSSLPTSAQLEATPAFLGLAILMAVNLVFIIDIELTMGVNRAFQDQEEEEWGFGQILAILLLLLPIRDVVEAILARRLKQRERELDEDLQEAIAKEDFDGIKRAIDRGSAFPSPNSSDRHWRFWSIISTHGALDYFDNLRRTRMTITEKALESDLHLAIEAKDDIRITAAYNQDADLIAGALQLSREAIGVVFWYAIGHAHDQIVQFHAARSDQPVNTQGPNRRTALMHASRKGDEQLNSPPRGGNRGHEKIVKVLLERDDIQPNTTDECGRVALICASQKGHEVIVKLLLDRHDIQPNVADKGGKAPLIHASCWGHTAITKMLLGREDILPNALDEMSRTALNCAAEKGHEGITRLLLERDDVDPNAADSNGWTPLIHASHQGRTSIAKMLLERHDIKPNAADKNGWPPLIYASCRGHEVIAKILLGRADVQPNVVTKTGRTLLICASESGRQDIVKMLLDRADLRLDATDKDGRTAHDIATANGHDTIARMILEHSRQAYHEA